MRAPWVTRDTSAERSCTPRPDTRYVERRLAAAAARGIVLKRLDQAVGGNKLRVFRLGTVRMSIWPAIPMPIHAQDLEIHRDNNDPVTLHRIMQSMIGEGLKAHYKPTAKLPHELFVLMMQLKENERSRQARRSQTKRQAEKAGVALARSASLP